MKSRKADCQRSNQRPDWKRNLNFWQGSDSKGNHVSWTSATSRTNVLSESQETSRSIFITIRDIVIENMRRGKVSHFPDKTVAFLSFFDLPGRLDRGKYILTTKMLTYVNF